MSIANSVCEHVCKYVRQVYVWLYNCLFALQWLLKSSLFKVLLQCFFVSADKCRCTAEYGIKIKEIYVKAHCGKWSGASNYCYLTGGINAASCPNAQKSLLGGFYYSINDRICKGEQGMQGVLIFIFIKIIYINVQHRKYWGW